ncbi:MAG: hypothetical protein WCH98_21005 [Verrucomicrobiota bacterium]
MNSGGDARDFRGIWRSAAEITPGRFEAVEIGGQKESRAIAGPALMAIQGRALYLYCFNSRPFRTSDRPPFRETLDSGLTHYQGYFNLRTRLACDLILATGEPQGGLQLRCGKKKLSLDRGNLRSAQRTPFDRRNADAVDTSVTSVKSVAFREQ